MGFQPVFGGGGVIYPAQQTEINLTLSANTTLQWPVEQQVGGSNIAAAIVAVTAGVGPFSITLSDATLVSNGYAILFDNIGANGFTVKDSGGGTLLTVASGEAWVLYLRDNSTSAGTWRSFQQGAGTSSANAASLAGAGLKAVTTTLNQRWQFNPQSSNYAAVDADRAKVILWTGGVGTLTLPDPATVGADWFVAVKNAGTGGLTVQAAAGNVDEASSVFVEADESSFFTTDGADWYSIGFGQHNNSVFDYVSFSVAGTGDYTLAGAQLNRVAYQLTGILTGDRNIIVPNTVQQYWVNNATSGAFNLTVKTAAGTGITVPQGSHIILYCDGTNVVNAETNTANLPAVVQGDILYGSSPGVVSALPKNTTAQRVLANSGASNNPQWDQVNILLGLAGYYAANKSVATSRFSTTVSAADPDLVLTLAVGTYAVEVLALIGGPAAAGFRCQLLQTGTMTGTIALVGRINGAVVAPASNGLNTDFQFATLAGTNDEWVTMRARVAVTVGGTLSFAWAQNTSNVTNTSVFVGYINAIRVA